MQLLLGGMLMIRLCNLRKSLIVYFPNWHYIMTIAKKVINNWSKTENIPYMVYIELYRIFELLPYITFITNAKEIEKINLYKTNTRIQQIHVI